MSAEEEEGVDAETSTLLSLSTSEINQFLVHGRCDCRLIRQNFGVRLRTRESIEIDEMTSSTGNSN